MNDSTLRWDLKRSLFTHFYTLGKHFEQILPDFDRDKVLVSDIKKLIKWFNFLNARNLLELPVEGEEVEVAAEEEEE